MQQAINFLINFVMNVNWKINATRTKTVIFKREGMLSKSKYPRICISLILNSDKISANIDICNKSRYTVWFGILS
jgi:hypothetical protein